MFFSDRFIAATATYSTHEQPVAAPYLRRAFICDGRPGKAELVICGLGMYRAFVNGIEITVGRMAPYQSNPDDLLYYDGYDITEYLRDGENVLGLLLGNGFLNSIGGQVWQLDEGSFRSAPKASVSLHVDGRLLFEADSAFKTHPSPILFDDVREGECFDARNETVGWNCPGTDDTGWGNATIVPAPAGRPTVSGAPPLVVSGESEPVKIRRCPGGYIYEFERNTMGVCRLALTDGTPGTRIRLTYFEVLDEAGMPYINNLRFEGKTREGGCQQDIYICRGGIETYEPSFTYHGFRYVFVEGLREEQATLDTLTLVEIHADVRSTGRFSCSDRTIMRLCSMIRQSDLSNLYHFPTDCPHREKNGWTGDAALSVEQMMLQFDMAAYLAEWMKNIRCAQRADGALPGIVPTGGWGFNWGNGPGWDCALFWIPYMVYRYSGDISVVADNADAMQRYVEYMRSRRRPDGLLAYGLGDWFQPSVSDPNYFRTPLEITDTLVCVDLCEKAWDMFTRLGQDERATGARELGKQLKDAFCATWMDRERRTLFCETQTAQVLALKYGCFAEEFRQAAAEELVRRIDACESHIDVGIIGGYALYDTLTEYGYEELAFKLITQCTPPSYGYGAARGETTLWEGFYDFGDRVGQAFLRDGRIVQSCNHHFWGFVYAWFVRTLAGLNVNPDLTDPDHVEIRLRPLKKLTFAETSYMLPSGRISVRWERVPDGIRLTVQVPNGATADVFCSGKRRTLRGGEYCLIVR